MIGLASDKKQISSQNSLEELLGDRLRSMGDILRDLEHDIRSRQAISEILIKGLENQYLEIRSRMLELEVWPRGSVPWVENQRNSLDRQLDGLSHELRQESLNCWRDMAILKRELRTWFKEYIGLFQRTSLVAPNRSLPTRPEISSYADGCWKNSQKYLEK